MTKLVETYRQERGIGKFIFDCINVQDLALNKSTWPYVNWNNCQFGSDDDLGTEISLVNRRNLQIMSR